MLPNHPATELRSRKENRLQLELESCLAPQGYAMSQVPRPFLNRSLPGKFPGVVIRSGAAQSSFFRITRASGSLREAILTEGLIQWVVAEDRSLRKVMSRASKTPEALVPDAEGSTRSSSAARAHDKVSNKACEPCRAAKVRCRIDEARPEGRCRRCSMTHRNCVFAAPATRKPSKRTDTRIIELEKEIQAMKNLMQHPMHLNSQATPPQDGSQSSRGGMSPSLQRYTTEVTGAEQRSTDDTSFHQTRHRYLGEPSNSHVGGGSVDALLRPERSGDSHVTTPISSKHEDVISRGIISLQRAEALFKTYNEDYAPQYPIVVFPEMTTATQIRSSKPTLFMAVLAAASGSFEAPLFRDLNAELLRVFAYKIVLSCEKTIELVQAMLLMAAWYFPPDRFEDLKHYQYIHMAATMAVEVGLSEAKDSRRPWLGENTGLSPYSSPDTAGDGAENSAVRCRTLLACYLLCAGVAMSADRPNMLRFTPYMEECLSTLRSSSEAAPTDGRLVAWVELQRLSEEVADSFRSQPQGSISIETPGVQATMQRLSTRFDEWKRMLDVGVMDDSLNLQYHFNRSRIFEVAFYGDHSFEDFRPPYLVRTARDHSRGSPCLTPPYVKAILTLVGSTQEVLDSILRMSTSVLRAAPVMHYIRAFYAITVLLEISMSAKRPGNELVKIVDEDSLRIEPLLSDLEKILMNASGRGRCRSSEKFRSVFRRAHEWWRRQHDTESGLDLMEQELRPLLNLSLHSQLQPDDVESNVRPAAHPPPQYQQGPVLRSDSDLRHESWTLQAAQEVVRTGYDDMPAKETLSSTLNRNEQSGTVDGRVGNKVENATFVSSFAPGSESATSFPNQTSIDPPASFAFDGSIMAMFNTMSESITHSFLPDVEMNCIDDSLFADTFGQQFPWEGDQQRPR